MPLKGHKQTAEHRAKIAASLVKLAAAGAHPSQRREVREKISRSILGPNRLSWERVRDLVRARDRKCMRCFKEPAPGKLDAHCIVQASRSTCGPEGFTALCRNCNVSISHMRYARRWLMQKALLDQLKDDYGYEYEQFDWYREWLKTEPDLYQPFA